MRNAAISTSIFASFALMLGACGNPMGPIPGGALSGEEEEWPADWNFSSSIENVLVETNPEDPYSVTVWGVAVDDEFYIAGASEDSRWVGNLLKYGFMKLSISGSIYAGRATQVTASDQIQNVLKAYVVKYDIDTSEGSNFIEDGGVLFRLSAR